MKLTDLINLLAVILIPIAAVIIGQFLQDRSEKRKDKMKIFQLPHLIPLISSLFTTKKCVLVGLPFFQNIILLFPLPSKLFKIKQMLSGSFWNPWQSV